MNLFDGLSTFEKVLFIVGTFVIPLLGAFAIGAMWATMPPKRK